jgi:hypothetical protein
MTAAQLPLPLDLPPALGRDDFIVGAANHAALALIEAWPRWPAPVVALSGPAGSGKSHLVAIWQGKAGGRAIAASALTGALVDELAAPTTTRSCSTSSIAPASGAPRCSSPRRGRSLRRANCPISFRASGRRIR